MALGLAGCTVDGAESGVGVSAQDELQIANLSPDKRRKVVILGAGIAGMIAVRALRALATTASSSKPRSGPVGGVSPCAGATS